MPNFSYISLDYTESDQSILSGEYRCGEAQKKNKECLGKNNGDNSEFIKAHPQANISYYSRLVRWPIDKSTGRLATDSNGIVTAIGAWYTGVGEVQGAVSYTEKGKTTFFLNGNYYEGNGMIASEVGPNAKRKVFRYSKNWAYSPEGMYLSTKGTLWTATEHVSTTKLDRGIFYVNRKDFMP